MKCYKEYALFGGTMLGLLLLLFTYLFGQPHQEATVDHRRPTYVTVTSDNPTKERSLSQ